MDGRIGSPGRLDPLPTIARSQAGRRRGQRLEVVEAAQADIVARLGSLEETVLTLAEALLRPPARPARARAPREGTRI